MAVSHKLLDCNELILTNKLLDCEWDGCNPQIFG